MGISGRGQAGSEGGGWRNRSDAAGAPCSLAYVVSFGIDAEAGPHSTASASEAKLAPNATRPTGRHAKAESSERWNDQLALGRSMLMVASHRKSQFIMIPSCGEVGRYHPASVGKPRQLALGLLAFLILRKPNPRFRQFGGKRPVFGMLQLC